MAFRIKKQKVNRRYLYQCIQAQQAKLMELFGALEATKSFRNYQESRIQELTKQLTESTIPYARDTTEQAVQLGNIQRHPSPGVV